MDFESEIMELLSQRNYKSMKLTTLVDLGNEIDDDGEDYPIVSDIVTIVGNKVYIYDECDEDETGIVNPIWDLAQLDDKTKESVLFAVKKTLQDMKYI